MNVEALEHAFLNQIERDFDDKDFEAYSEMMALLLKSKKNQLIIYNYLCDGEQDDLLDKKTNTRY